MMIPLGKTFFTRRVLLAISFQNKPNFTYKTTFLILFGKFNFIFNNFDRPWQFDNVVIYKSSNFNFLNL